MAGRRRKNRRLADSPWALSARPQIRQPFRLIPHQPTAAFQNSRLGARLRVNQSSVRDHGSVLLESLGPHADLVGEDLFDVPEAIGEVPVQVSGITTDGPANHRARLREPGSRRRSRRSLASTTRSAGFLATSQRLRDAFSDLRFELPLNGIAATGKRIKHKQVHIFRVADGQITHHRAVRDDLGLLLQLGWRPSG